MFRHNLSGPFSNVLNCLALEDVTDRLYRNVGNYHCMVRNVPEDQNLLKPLRKSEIMKNMMI
jgi:hypothetical protein